MPILNLRFKCHDVVFVVATVNPVIFTYRNSCNGCNTQQDAHYEDSLGLSNHKIWLSLAVTSDNDSEISVHE
jgi:hypothetical protein